MVTACVRIKNEKSKYTGHPEKGDRFFFGATLLNKHRASPLYNFIQPLRGCVGRLNGQTPGCTLSCGHNFCIVFRNNYAKERVYRTGRSAFDLPGQ